MTDDELNELMTKAQDSLSNGSYREAAEALEEIAKCFAGIGDIESFFNLRKHIIDMASLNTSQVFINEQLIAIERERANERIRITVN